MCHFRIRIVIWAPTNTQAGQSMFEQRHVKIMFEQHAKPQALIAVHLKLRRSSSDAATSVLPCPLSRAGAGAQGLRAAAMAQSRVLREVVRAYSYVVLWMAVSSSVILFNKWLLAFSGFPYPIALTAWHMLFCSTVGMLCVRGLRVVKSHKMSAHDYLRRVMPIGAHPTCRLCMSCVRYKSRAGLLLHTLAISCVGDVGPKE